MILYCDNEQDQINYKLFEYNKKLHFDRLKPYESSPLMVKGEGVFCLHNINIIVFFYYLIATCFGHTTIFKYIYFSEFTLLTTDPLFFFKNITYHRE
jgi:hypothetical protein